MKEKIELKNATLKFFNQDTLREYPSPIGEYLQDFPFEKYDFDKISSRPDEVNKLIEELDAYFKAFKPIFHFQSGVTAYPYEIWIDRSRINQLKNGDIPIYLFFAIPNIANSKGSFNWEVK